MTRPFLWLVFIGLDLIGVTENRIIDAFQDHENTPQSSFTKTESLQNARGYPNCGAQLNVTLANPTIFTSPNYPNYFPLGVNCLWILNGPPETRVNVACYPVSVSCSSGNGLGFSKTAQLSMGDGEYYCGTGLVAYLSDARNLTVNLQGTVKGYVKCQAQAIANQRTTTPPTTTWQMTTPPTTIQQTNRMSTTTVSTTGTTAKPPCGCGIKGQSRIVNGNSSNPGEWPWQVMLRYGSTEEFGCGGVVIDHEWVMTAGHCVKDVVDDPSYVKVELGAYYRNSKTADRQMSQVVKIYLHESYDKITMNNDIALLKLASPIAYTSTVRPACLPINFNMEAFKGQVATVTGWGAVREGGSLADTLQKLVLPVLPTKECQPYYANSLLSKISDNMFCTYAEGRDACQGDSGGPLNWYNPVTGRVTVVGLVSWGIGCARDGKPGVYTKVANYTPWIRKTTGLNFCTA